MGANALAVSQAVERTAAACQTPRHAAQLMSLQEVIHKTVAGKARSDLMYYNRNAVMTTAILGMFTMMFGFILMVLAFGGGTGTFPTWLIMIMGGVCSISIGGAVHNHRRLPARLTEHGIVASGQTGYRWTVENNGSDVTVTLLEISRGIKRPTFYTDQEQCQVKIIHQETMSSIASAGAYMDAVNLSIDTNDQHRDRVARNQHIQNTLAQHQIHSQTIHTKSLPVQTEAS